MDWYVCYRFIVWRRKWNKKCHQNLIQVDWVKTWTCKRNGSDGEDIFSFSMMTLWSPPHTHTHRLMPLSFPKIQNIIYVYNTPAHTFQLYQLNANGTYLCLIERIDINNLLAIFFTHHRMGHPGREKHAAPQHNNMTWNKKIVGQKVSLVVELVRHHSERRLEKTQF